MVVLGGAGGAGGGQGGVVDLLLQVVRRAGGAGGAGGVGGEGVALEYLVNPAANDPRVLTRTLTYHYLAAANMKVLLWPWNLCSEYVTVTVRMSYSLFGCSFREIVEIHSP